jgi:membrane-associated phospholipid phosphatase
MSEGQRLHRVATVVTEVCSPAVVVVLLPLAVAWHATGHHWGATVLWGLVVALFSSVLPMAFIIRGARQGRWDGHHVRNREGRLVPLLLCLATTVVGLAILLTGRAPPDVVALDVAMLVTLLVCTAITQLWKISLHSAVAGGAAATLVLIYGPLSLVLVPLVVLIAWSRVVVRDHSVTQVIAGALTGPVVGGVVFVLVR